MDKEKDLDKKQEFYDKIKSLIRNLGKSNMIHKDEIEDLLEEYE